MTASDTGNPDGIAETLFGRTRRNVLALLFGRPDEKFYLREIARQSGTGTGAVQRELAQLVEAGLVRRAPHGKQVYFSANRGSPVFEELRGLLAKTAGLADVLRIALADIPQSAAIRVAFIHGSVATGRHTSESDVDLVVIGDVQLSSLLPALSPVQERLGREVNPIVFRVEEFAAKYANGEHFVRRVLEKPKIMLIGSADDLARLAGKPLAGRA